ncbi:ABC transporter substrate-binding protein [Bradyrhizobium canariense]|uniref:Amino acid/amide ABC transporter substrate-binding protein, HAAT family n=1 Tax=Bradyrhizobium canariense TaxID=255045 RepID=A0A1H1SND8_9BRAD|nr:ABC transporter substrate-binding protein [Bradyrhizobium canariense]SDS49485.1 amino acid/amide ABC transporter substrate-binding protein, HAAT family [Bradyrhizobium canariense]
MMKSASAFNRRHIVGMLSLSLTGLGMRPSFGQGAEEIAIGMVLPFTGATGPYGPDMKKAADLVVKTINDAGGILGGRKFHLYIEDSETSATTSVTATHKLLDVNKVEVVGGFWGSPEALAAKPLILAANKVEMVSAAADAITDGDNKGQVYRFQAKSSQWGPAGAKVVTSLNLKKINILAQQNPFVVAMIEPFKAEMAKRGGTVLDVIMYNPNQASYRAEVEKAFGSEPDGVFCGSLLTDFVAIAKEVYRGGYQSKIVGLGTGADADGAFLKSVPPEVAEGIHHLQPGPPLNSDAYRKFVKEMGAPEGTVFLFAGNTHDQVCVTALAMEHAKSSDAAVWVKSIPEVCNPPGEEVDDIVRALEMVRAGKKTNFVGAGATVDFNERGDQLNRSFVHQVIHNGKNEIVEIVT